MDFLLLLGMIHTYSQHYIQCQREAKVITSAKSRHLLSNFHDGNNTWRGRPVPDAYLNAYLPALSSLHNFTRSSDFPRLVMIGDGVADI